MQVLEGCRVGMGWLDSTAMVAGQSTCWSVSGPRGGASELAKRWSAPTVRADGRMWEGLGFKSGWSSSPLSGFGCEGRPGRAQPAAWKARAPLRGFRVHGSLSISLQQNPS